MPPDLSVVSEPGSPQDWLRHAQSDLVLARVGMLEGVLLETLCYHAQQAAEKSIKAVLIRTGVAFPRTHNLTVLASLLPQPHRGNPLLRDAAALTDYAVMGRYPVASEHVTEDEYREALTVAEEVVGWATQAVSS
ncbi:MAG: HEPN domain-containing protein [Anaerolineae bacterium]